MADDYDDETPPRVERRRTPRRRITDQEPARAPVPVDVQGLPSWLRAAVFLGVPSVIAMFLVYVLSVDIAKRVQAIEQQQQLQAQTLAALAAAATARQEDANEVRQHFDEAVAQLNYSLRRLCVAISETPAERAYCLASGRVEP